MKKYLSAIGLSIIVTLAGCSSDPAKLARECDNARSALIAYEAVSQQRTPTEWETLAALGVRIFIEQRCVGIGTPPSLQDTRIELVPKFVKPANEFQAKFNVFLDGIGQTALEVPVAAKR